MTENPFAGVAGLKVRHTHPDGTTHAHERGWEAHGHEDDE
jgi:hypothetical protein